MQTFSSEYNEIFPVQTTRILGSNPRNIRKKRLSVRPKTLTKKRKKEKTKNGNCKEEANTAEHSIDEHSLHFLNRDQLIQSSYFFNTPAIEKNSIYRKLDSKLNINFDLNTFMEHQNTTSRLGDLSNKYTNKFVTRRHLHLNSIRNKCECSHL